MPETQHIEILWNDDVERPWFVEAEPGQADGETYSVEADVPDELWARWQAALDELDMLERQLCEAAGYDPASGCLTEPCGRWEGDVRPGRAWWTIVLEASGSEDVWPVIDATITHRDTREQAEAWIASLPEQIRLVHTHAAADGFQTIERDRLRIERSGFGESVSACHRCGHSIDDHPTDAEGAHA